MGAIDWAQSSIHASRIREIARPPKERLVVAPSRIDVDDLRWRAVRVAPRAEMRVAADLTALGFRAYCPLGAKIAFWRDGVKNGRRKFVRLFPVFTGYIFAGISGAQSLGRNTVDKIVSILGNASGPIDVPSRVIRVINDLEMAYHWDETRSWREKSSFQPGSPVRITEGAYAAYSATVDALVSETRIKILIGMFGQTVPIELDAGAVELI